MLPFLYCFLPLLSAKLVFSDQQLLERNCGGDESGGRAICSLVVLSCLGGCASPPHRCLPGCTSCKHISLQETTAPGSTWSKLSLPVDVAGLRQLQQSGQTNEWCVWLAGRAKRITFVCS